MKNKIIILIILVILIAVGSHFVINRYILEKNPEPGPSEETNNNVNETNLPKPVSSLIFIAGLSQEDLAILQESDNYTALLKQLRLCEAKADSKDCQADVELRQVFMLDDSKLCNQIYLQDDCLARFAIKDSNGQLCQEINNIELQDYCVNYTASNQAADSGDVSLCGVINDDNIRDSCIYNIVSKQEDLNFCNDEFFASHNSVNECKSIILLNMAMTNGDKNFCLDIPLEKYKQDCLSEL